MRFFDNRVSATGIIISCLRSHDNYTPQQSRCLTGLLAELVKRLNSACSHQSNRADGLVKSNRLVAA
jgi:hypothetical protein